MSKNLLSLVFVGIIFICIVLMWKVQVILNTLVDETGYLRCVPELTRPELCQEFKLYKSIFAGVSLVAGLLWLFRKKIIKD